MPYATVRDIPDDYTLLQGDAAEDMTGQPGCAFVIVNEGEVISLYTTDYSVPWLDAPVREILYIM